MSRQKKNDRTWAAPRLAVAAVLSCLVAPLGCKVKDPPPVTAHWVDDFERTSIGGNYYKTGGGHRIIDGALSTQGSYNHPLWLRKKLPRNVQIEFDAWSNSKAGDIKVEVFGDGTSYDPDRGKYVSSGYVLVMGGWNNSKSMIARRDEHGKDLVERRQPKVKPGQRYHWIIKREGDAIEWWIDDAAQPFLRYEDKSPLIGEGHEYFSFNNWESDAWFDNLSITPL